MSKKTHVEYEKRVIHPAVKEFLKEKFHAKVPEQGIFIPCNEYPRPVRSVGLDLLGLADDFSVLVECKALTTPYVFGQGLGELLLYWTLLKSKKSEVEAKIKAAIHEPILPYLSVCDFGHKNNIKQYKWTCWDEKYKQLFNDLKRNFKNFNPGLLLVKRKKGVDKPAQKLVAKDIRVDFVDLGGLARVKASLCPNR